MALYILLTSVIRAVYVCETVEAHRWAENEQWGRQVDYHRASKTSPSLVVMVSSLQTAYIGKKNGLFISAFGTNSACLSHELIHNVKNSSN